jgi:hypothetical protein
MAKAVRRAPQAHTDAAESRGFHTRSPGEANGPPLKEGAVDGQPLRRIEDGRLANTAAQVAGAVHFQKKFD